MKINKKYIKMLSAVTAAFVVMVMSLPSLVVNAQNYGAIEAYAVDTVAGYSALISTSQTAKGQAVVISVKKPDGSVVKIPAVTNEDGVAKVDMYDYHTRKSGRYGVSAYLEDSPIAGNVNYFNVYPDEISLDKSKIVAQRNVSRADDEDPVYLTVSLKDQYGNPFQGHMVRVISSRVDDEVTATDPSSITDVNGVMTFRANSPTKGVSIYSAVDSTSGAVISSRAQVAYLSGTEYGKEMGGTLDMFIPAASAEGAGPLNKFEISDISEPIVANQNTSFTVTAQDVNGLTVSDYTGTIRFAAEGSNSEYVTLPEDYTFDAGDLGEHEFSLGLNFSVDGDYKILVADSLSPLIEGEKMLTVGGESTSGSTSGSGSGTLALLTPVAGTYSQNVQTISGDASDGVSIKIFDNDLEIGSVVASGGIYSYQTAPLDDGNHTFYVVSLDSSEGVDETSPSIDIVIDTTAPLVDQIEINPTDGITTETIINIKVLSEQGLSESALIFNEEIVELSESLDQDGAYVATLQAPSVAGEYGIDVLLADQLGNEATYKNESMISVSDDGTASVSQPGDEVVDDVPEETPEDVEEPEEVLDGSPPSQVFGVIAYGSDERVTLVWESAIDDVMVDHYRIYYGLLPENLDSSVDTKDASTTWYVPELENGKEYFFSIVAVDGDDLESVDKSELVNGIPFSLEVEVEVPDRPETELRAHQEDPYLKGAAVESIPPEMTKNGPGILWLLFGTGALSGVASKLTRKKRK